MAGTGVFRDKVVVVTGGASGIGRALGEAMFMRGAHVVLADTDRGGLDEVVGSAGPGDGSIAAAVLDVRDRDAVVSVVHDVFGRHGRLDFLFNNAGITLGGETHKMPVEYWDRIIDVNVRGVVNGVAAAYPLMVRQGFGHIVNTASAAGLVGPPLTAAYSMTKSAVVGLSTTLRPEAALHGVRVSALCPGSVETPILDAMPPSDLPPAPETTLTARQFLEKFRLSPMPVGSFVERALRGVAANRAIIVVPGNAKALWYLQRVSYSAMGRITRAMARRIVADLRD